MSVIPIPIDMNIEVKDMGRRISLAWGQEEWLLNEETSVRLARKLNAVIAKRFGSGVGDKDWREYE
jgi:methylmalonyl-CoA mutase N-terminal domain/subunit